MFDQPSRTETFRNGRNAAHAVAAQDIGLLEAALRPVPDEGPPAMAGPSPGAELEPGPTPGPASDPDVSMVVAPVGTTIEAPAADFSEEMLSFAKGDTLAWPLRGIGLELDGVDSATPR